MPRARSLVLPALGALVCLGAATALLEVPGERQLKELAGIEYGPPPCPPLGPVSLGAWREEGSLPSLRDEPRGVRVGDGIFIAGGIGRPKPQQSVDVFERYDLRTRRYERLPPLPQAANHIGIAAWRGDVYVAGGFTEAGGRVVPTAKAWRYAVAERRWEELAPMPTARGALGVAIAGNTLYAIGGHDPAVNRDFTAVEALDLRTGAWSPRAPISSERDHLAAAVAGGRVYAAGGRRTDGTALDAFERYDPAADRWEPLAKLPAATSGFGMEPVGGRLVIAGGELPAEDRVLDGVWSFDPAAGTWTQAARLPLPKHGYASAAADGRLYVFGGSRCAGFNPVERSESLEIPAA